MSLDWMVWEGLFEEEPSEWKPDLIGKREACGDVGESKAGSGKLVLGNAGLYEIRTQVREMGKACPVRPLQIKIRSFVLHSKSLRTGGVVNQEMI